MLNQCSMPVPMFPGDCSMPSDPMFDRVGMIAMFVLTRQPKVIGHWEALNNPGPPPKKQDKKGREERKRKKKRKRKRCSPQN